MVRVKVETSLIGRRVKCAQWAPNAGVAGKTGTICTAWSDREGVHYQAEVDGAVVYIMLDGHSWHLLPEVAGGGVFEVKS